MLMITLVISVAGTSSALMWRMLRDVAASERDRSLNMMKSNIAWIGALALSMMSGAAGAAEHVVAQKSMAFSTNKLSVKVGDSVKFVNEDPYAHNLFSLSETKSFDLGPSPQGGSKSVVFDKAGTVEIECAMHPDMKLTVQVKK